MTDKKLEFTQKPDKPEPPRGGGFRLWYLRVVALLAPFIIALETYQITNQFEQGGISKVNVIDVILLIAWAFVFMRLTIPFVSELLNRKRK